MIVGLDNLPDEAQGTRPWKYGWQEKKVNFGSDSDYLPCWLNEVTAIINIPSIMDDNVIGLRAAIANLTLSLIKSPAKLYKYIDPRKGNFGDPFLAEIYNLPQIRGKVRLHIANGLRILYYGGPVVKQSYVYEHSSLIFSTDPVSLDRVALELIRRAGSEKHLPDHLNRNIVAPYLITAQALGLGYYDLENNFIQYKRIRHGKE